MFIFRQYGFLLAGFAIYLLTGCGTSPSAPPEISWDLKLATPGAQIKFEKTSKVEKFEKPGQITYMMSVSGLPKDKSYVFSTKWVDGETETINNKDIIKDLFEGGMAVRYGRMFRGEPLYYAVISTDQTARAYAQLVPFPLEAVSESGCKLSMTLLSAKGRPFHIVGEGFKPGEQVKTISKSGSEILQDELIAPEGRAFTAIIDPGVVGKTGGLATFQASSKSCSVAIDYEWGTAMKKVGE